MILVKFIYMALFQRKSKEEISGFPGQIIEK